MENEEDILRRESKKNAILGKIQQLRHSPILSERIHNNDSLDATRTRNAFQRDYARILYSSAFRRLQGKMQMLGIDNVSFYRNRLTHSLEVSQVARSICARLAEHYETEFWNTNEIYLIEAISLAHDLGNPPFGHAGEHMLNKLSEEIGGFEGNAQTFRIVTVLEQKYPAFEGLNLTRRTLLGLVKHFYKKEQNKSKFLYSDDYKRIEEILKDAKLTLKPGEKTIDCAVMDLADEIAYAAHDLEDALQQKYINVDDFQYLFAREVKNPKKLKNFSVADLEIGNKKLNDLIDSARKTAMETQRGDSDDIFDTIFRKELSSAIVDALIRDVDFIEGENNLGFKSLGALCAGLKILLFEAIKNDSPMILFYEKQGNHILTGLYEVFSDPDFNKNNYLLNSTYRLFDEKDDIERKRRIIDYISGMMDNYAIEQYEKYFGRGSLEKIYTNQLALTSQSDCNKKSCD